MKYGNFKFLNQYLIFCRDLFNDQLLTASKEWYHHADPLKRLQPGNATPDNLREFSASL